MVWSGFKIPQSFITENSKQRTSFNTGCATNLSYQKVSSNFGIFKQASENSP